jgi:hypothetical protein
MNKKKYSFSIEPATVEGLKTIKARFGMSESEQVRRAIELWLKSFEWPARSRQRNPPTRHDDVGGHRALG